MVHVFGGDGHVGDLGLSLLAALLAAVLLLGLGLDHQRLGRGVERAQSGVGNVETVGVCHNLVRLALQSGALEIQKLAVELLGLGGGSSVRGGETAEREQAGSVGRGTALAETWTPRV